MKLSVLIADHFETLSSGKILALGLFPDRVVVINLPLQADGTPPAPPYAVELSILCCFTELSSEVADLHLEVIPPEGGKPIARITVPQAAMDQGRSFNVIGKIAPLLASSSGFYAVKANMGKETAADQFELRIQFPVPAADTAGKPPRPKPARKVARRQKRALT